MRTPEQKAIYNERSKAHNQEVRDIIKTRTLVSILHADATGDKPITMGQRKSIEILLSKTLPSLANLTADPTMNYPLLEQDIAPPQLTVIEGDKIGGGE